MRQRHSNRRLVGQERNVHRQRQIRCIKNLSSLRSVNIKWHLARRRVEQLLGIREEHGRIVGWCARTDILLDGISAGYVYPSRTIYALHLGMPAHYRDLDSVSITNRPISIFVDRLAVSASTPVFELF